MLPANDIRVGNIACGCCSANRTGGKLACGLVVGGGGKNSRFSLTTIALSQSCCFHVASVTNRRVSPGGPSKSSRPRSRTTFISGRGGFLG